MQKIVFKRAIPFRTRSGTIETDTIVAEDGGINPDEIINVVGVFDRTKTVVRYSSRCIFRRNSILHAEPFPDDQLPAA